MSNNTDNMNLHAGTDKYNVKPDPSHTQDQQYVCMCGIHELGNVCGKLPVIQQTNTVYSVNQYINALQNCHHRIFSMFNE